MCVSVCLYMHVHVSPGAQEDKRGCGSLGAGVTNSCELSEVGAGNLT